MLLSRTPEIRIMARSFRRIAFAASIGLAGLNDALSGAAAADLDGPAIASELVGRSIVWWEEGGWHKGHLLLSPDGTAEISVDNPEPTGDVGRWAIRGGDLCTVWGDLREGREKCYSVRRAPDGRFVTSGGNVFEIRDAGV
jgi:hypothetical protein